MDAQDSDPTPTTLMAHDGFGLSNHVWLDDCDRCLQVCREYPGLALLVRCNEGRFMLTTDAYVVCGGVDRLVEAVKWTVRDVSVYPELVVLDNDVSIVPMNGQPVDDWVIHRAMSDVLKAAVAKRDAERVFYETEGGRDDGTT